MDVAASAARAQATHESVCPEIGPICETRVEPPQVHHTTLWLTELRLHAEYGVAPGVALQAMLPLRWVDTRTRYTDLSGAPLALDYENIHHRNETLVRLGDAQLFSHVGLGFAKTRMGARLGVNLPTGKVHEDPYRLGHEGRAHQHVQFGTGTFDPLLAADVERTFGAFGVGAFVHLHPTLYAGPRGYQQGSRFYGGVVFQSGLGLEDFTFRLGLNGLHEAAERWHGVVPLEDGNQGRTDVYLGPGVTYAFSDDYSVSLDVRGRLYGHTVNAQLSLPVVVEVSFGRLFHLESGEHEEDGEHHDEDEAGDVEDVVHSGEAAKLTPVLGKWTVFDFWATWCEACKTLDRELRHIAGEQDDVAIRRVNIVDFDSPIAQQELQGVSALPYVRIVDPSGNVAWQGTATPDQAIAELRSRLPKHDEHPGPPARTP